MGSGDAIVALSGPEAPEWIPIPGAAALLRCSARSIERLVSAKKIEARAVPREGRRPGRLVLRRDVEALLPAAFVAPGAQVPQAVERVLETRVDQRLREFLNALAVGMASALPAPPAPAAPGPLFVSLARASELTGLSRRWLAGAIERGELAAVRDGRRTRVRLRDLESL